MRKKMNFLFGVVITVTLLGFACTPTLTGPEATKALEIETQTPDIGSLQYVVSIKNKTSNKVQGKIRVICDIYPKTPGDTTALYIKDSGSKPTATTSKGWWRPFHFCPSKITAPSVLR